MATLDPNKNKNWQKFKALREQMLGMTGAPRSPKLDHLAWSLPPEEAAKLGSSFFDDGSAIKIMPNTSASSRGSKFKPYMASWQQQSGIYKAFDSYGEQEVQLVLFYGFSGLCPFKYSIVKDMTADEITARMEFAGKKVPYSVQTMDAFKPVIDLMAGTPTPLQEIEMDKALLIIRSGVDMTKGFETFVDAEVDEFDDNCVETCKPGLHACGKNVK